MREIGRAVQGINDPAVFMLLAFEVRFFFRQDRVIGKNFAGLPQ